MSGVNRRSFLLSMGALLSVAGTGRPVFAGASPKARILVIGGGFGGAVCAKYLKELAPLLDVTLLEQDESFITCPFSNLYLAGLRDLASLTHDYGALKSKYGVNVVHDTVTALDVSARQAVTRSGDKFTYDRVVVSPGISFKWEAVPGYDEAAAETIPHAWKAGAQTELLRKQLHAMPDGGKVIIAAPGNPFRCPPGPYERASMMAHYLSANKPKSKIVILDAKDKFSKQGLFMEGWQTLYPGMIEWVAGSEGGVVERVDAKNRTLLADSGFTTHTADVINFIPPQQAGAIAVSGDLTDESGWCPVNQHTFESTRHENVYVIGDSSIAGKMPKSGFSANSQAKVCAAAIVTSLGNGSLAEPSYANTCYSLVGRDYGISVSDVYRLQNGEITPVAEAGGVSPSGAHAAFRKAEARFARGWYDSITADTFG